MRNTLICVLVISTLPSLSAAGDAMFDDLIYQDQHQAVIKGGAYGNSILPGGCVKPTGGWNDPYVQSGTPWSQYERPGYWNDRYWPRKYPRYYRRYDKYSRFRFDYAPGNLYAPGNQYLWQRRYYDRFRRPPRVPYYGRYYDRYGNWWYGGPRSYLSYDMYSYNGRSYGYFDGNRVVTGFDTPTTSFRFDFDNGMPRYWDPYVFSGPSFGFGLTVRR